MHQFGFSILNELCRLYVQQWSSAVCVEQLIVVAKFCVVLGFLWNHLANNLIRYNRNLKLDASFCNKTWFMSPPIFGNFF